MSALDGLEELMSRNPLGLTDDEVMQIVKVQREQRKTFVKSEDAGEKAPRAKAAPKAPRKTKLESAAEKLGW